MLSWPQGTGNTIRGSVVRAVGHRMKIANKNSFLVVEGEPSLLTSVPADLRNMIYEILFVGNNNQLLLHNTKVLHSRLSRTDDHDSESEYITDLEEFNECTQAKVGTSTEFAQDMHLGLPLLLTCRQIYHEAASLLYGHNEFIFSRTIHEHDRAPFVMFPEPEQYSQFLYAPKWLDDLGTQAQFLRKVTIDIDATCPSDCRSTYQYAERIDLLPYAHFLWRRAHPDYKVKFKHTGRLLTCHVYDGTHFSKCRASQQHLGCYCHPQCAQFEAIHRHQAIACGDLYRSSRSSLRICRLQDVEWKRERPTYAV